jgi:GH24 family phage-related lysozyme (muramidase)
MADYLEQSLKKLEQFEGSIPWMYRDTAGHVTVGVGLMLPDASAAAHLPFAVDGRRATADEIAAEFARVDALPMGRPALFYRAPDGGQGKPELPQTEIDSLLQSVLSGFEGELKSALPAYDGFPDSVKMALLDMAYNLGPAGLLHGYPRLIKAVETGNWAQAAANCGRVGPGAARNNWTRQMFLQDAVVTSIKAEAESAIKQVGYGLVGIAAGLWQRARKK